MSNYTEIVEGWGNLIFPNKKVEYEAKMRAIICSECSLYNVGMCNFLKEDEAVRDFTYRGEERKKGQKYSGCGCPIATKTRSMSSKCPLGKWLEANEE
mgnify:CR=1 FL=1